MLCKRKLLGLWIACLLLCNCFVQIFGEKTQDTNSVTQSVSPRNLEEETSEEIIKGSSSKNGEDLYKNALQILLKIFVKKRPQTTNDFHDVDSSILPLSLRMFGRMLMSTFFSRPSVDVGSQREKQHAFEPKNEKLNMAIQMLEKSALDYGNDDALYTLGQINFHAKYSHPRNLTAAFHYYRELAIRSGNATAQQALGFMYATGIGQVVKRDQGKALLYLTFAAHGGETAGQMTLAYRYLMGIGVERSCENAIFHYKKVADKAIEHYGSGPPGGKQLPPAKIRLYDEDGGVYGYGASSGHMPSKLGDAAAWDDIMEYYRYMAEHGDINAQLGLGQLFYQGTRNIPQDFNRALHYLNLVARQYPWPAEFDKIDSQTTNSQLSQAAGTAAGLLGQMHWRREGVEQNNRTAFLWFARGAKLGNPVAINGLGQMYLHGLTDSNGHELLPKSRKDAETFFKSAAEMDNADAQVNLGLIYLHHKRDIPAAYKCFLSAAQQAHFVAHYYLAEMNANGEGTKKSCPVAAAYYKNVAERGDWLHSPFIDAHNAFVSGDRDGALLNYLIAAERGYEIGQANVAWLLDRDKARWQLPHFLPNPDPAREELALIYWTRSANQGNVDARVKMGDYYFKGFGTPVDYEKAAACYQAAAEVDYSAMAMWNLGWMHENGIGVPCDFHLAKRFYDQSLATNPDAYLPVTLSLIKLYSKSIWNYLMGSDDNDNSGWSWSKGLWWDSSSFSETEEGGSGPADSGGDGSKQDRREWEMGPEEQLIRSYNARKKGNEEFTDSLDESYYDEEESQDLMESLTILAMCLLVGWLVYVRQLRWHRAENNVAGDNGRGGGGGGIGVGGDWPPQRANAGGMDDDNNGRLAWAAAGGH